MGFIKLIPEPKHITMIEKHWIPEYFVDVDMENHILTAIKIDSDNTQIVNNIDENDNYQTTNAYDFISLLKDDNQSKTSKFWGWTAFEDVGPCQGGLQTRHREYKAFWITVDHDYDVVPC